MIYARTPEGNEYECRNLFGGVVFFPLENSKGCVVEFNDIPSFVDALKYEMVQSYKEKRPMERIILRLESVTTSIFGELNDSRD